MNYLTFGREVYLPLDLMVAGLPSDQKATAPEYVGQLKQRLEDCFSEVRSHMKAQGEP